MIHQHHLYHLRHAIVALLITAVATLCIHADTNITINAIPGLRFDKVRFVVKPGETVNLKLVNADQMMHNLIITKPGTRQTLVTAALTLGERGQAMNFIPDSTDVLHKIPVLQPGQTKTLKFKAPTQPGIYPYVCTYPGHGFLMYGALYVQNNKTLPPLEKDTNIPEYARTASSAKSPHAYPLTRPMIYRAFVRGASPAAINVALPQNQNYCFDAAFCYLRFAWTGDFIDNTKHWAANGNDFSEIKGHTYHRNITGIPIRFNSPENKTTQVKFLGYKLINRAPMFRYKLNNHLVTEFIQTSPDAKGITRTFTIDNPTSNVYFIVNPDAGVTASSSVGTFSPQGVLTLTPEQAKNFTITLTEIPNHAPIAYYSMNDVTYAKKPYPVAGAVGRALTFDGKGKQHIKTNVKLSDLSAGATLSLWVNLTNPASKFNYTLIGSPDQSFSLDLNRRAGKPVTLEFKTSGQGALRVYDTTTDWQLITVTLTPDQFIIYINGNKHDVVKLKQLKLSNQPLFIASNGKSQFFKGILDEAKIYKRALPADEIKRMYNREHNQGREVRDQP